MTFCLVMPYDWGTWDTWILDRSPVERDIKEIAAGLGVTPNIVWINSDMPTNLWRHDPDTLLRWLNLPKPYTCLVAGLGGFAGAYVDKGYAVLGDYTLFPLLYHIWAENPVYSNRAQMGAIYHEAYHLLCSCGHDKMPYQVAYQWNELFTNH